MAQESQLLYAHRTVENGDRVMVRQCTCDARQRLYQPLTSLECWISRFAQFHLMMDDHFIAQSKLSSYGLCECYSIANLLTTANAIVAN